jgi:hypothetical protein
MSILSWLPLVLPFAQDSSVLGSFASSLPPEERTEVLVLGTPHLDQVQGFEPEMLAGLLDVLEAWEPQVVCVEALPARTLVAMQAEGSAYAPVLDSFGRATIELGRQAQEFLEVGRAEAGSILALEGAGLASWERALTALAALERPSALLAWALARDEGQVPDDLPEALVTRLDAAVASRNEISSLALALARRLGLPVLDAVDDHMDKDDYLALAGDLERELRGHAEVEAVAEAAAFVAAGRSLSAALEAGDLLPHYLLLDEPEQQAADVRAQWDVFLRTRLSSGLDRARLALWDVRNLAIAANVRRASARVPGGRVLVVIGAGHKPFLDALLGSALDVRLVRLSDLVEAR